MDKMHISGRFVEATVEMFINRWIRKKFSVSMPVNVDTFTADLSGEAFEATLTIRGTIDDTMKSKILMAMLKGT